MKSLYRRVKHFFLYLFSKKYRKMEALRQYLQENLLFRKLVGNQLVGVQLITHTPNSVLYRINFINDLSFTIIITVNNDGIIGVDIDQEFIPKLLVDNAYLTKKAINEDSDNIVNYF